MKNGIIESKELRENMINQVGVLEKVKDLLLLCNSEYATVKQVADYYEVGLEAIKSITKRNKEELENNGMKYYKKSEISLMVQLEPIENSNIPNRGTTLFTKRAILNVGMLLTESKVAEEVRRRLLDIEYESNNAIQENGKTVKENIVSEIDEEKELVMARVDAEMAGDYDQVWVINAKLFALKNKRISELEKEVETITTNSLTIIEAKSVINRLVRVISAKKFNGSFKSAYGELYTMINYKLGINIKARNKKSNQSYLDILTEDEIFETEKIVRTWANDNGIDVSKKITL